ncbi:class I adenylate-forming enzyme family protein [Kitasatospora viridis]|uniref:Acyl-CoA synthetase (AMP-forming)/AMP-acid ligase II n=1 Tax=Kitasatospora viridis TaxID=281105 RepID=A0A561UAB6_9ACTN|nr:class I adenylate-forming enzyme family protein [Kitasatospora viridis]TWF96306.1 acyl-CoA synthetase (AMP-forming)/AMP-acid ligase II [Kitasatospora viridis]
MHALSGPSTGQPLPAPPTILAQLDRWARLRGDAPWLTVVEGDGRRTTLSFRELDVRSQALADWLAREVGVRPGDVCGLLPVNDVPSVVAVFALLRSGCPILVLNPHDPPQRLAEQTAALGAGFVFRGPKAPDPGVGSIIRLPDRLPEAAGTGTARPGSGRLPGPEADALFFGTSGSTAASKLVAQTHANAAVNAYAVGRHHALRPGDRLLGCLPIHHVNGMHFTLFATLAAGAHAVLAESFSPFTYADIISEYRPRLASVVPSILESLLEARPRPQLPAEFEYFVSAAAPLATTTVQNVFTRLNARVLQGYGLTETTNFSTTMPRQLHESDYRALTLDSEIPPVGHALHGSEIAVLDPDGTPVPAGEVGEICMRGYNVMSRYVGNPAATDEAFANGWFHSGDLGFIGPDGTPGQGLLTITGRKKNIAKVGGESVSLEELERALLSFPPVRDAGCATMPDRRRGEMVVAAVVVSGELSEKSLLDHLRTRLSPAALPRTITRLEQIPRTATGKIRRSELADVLARAAAERPRSHGSRSE